MSHKRTGLFLALLALTLLVAAPSALAAQRHHYYLALGDSLAVGYQPLGAGGQGIETTQGYTNDLLAHYAKQVKKLKLVEVGCPRDTSGSLLTGQGNDASAAFFGCDRSGGSQLAAAVKFLKAHHHQGEVPLVTIDIGANDIVPCVSEPTFAQIITCVGAGEQAIKTNTPQILKALRKAAPKGTRFAAMNLYDPILADELNPSTAALGVASLTLTKSVNAVITTADKRSKFKTADVAKAFGTYNTSKPSKGQQVATDVVNICNLTWMCAISPIGPNIHANATGYEVIAGAFEKVVGKLK
jgi:lysophospholipase L1-like esterase